jgi:hypothetical protein
MNEYYTFEALYDQLRIGLVRCFLRSGTEFYLRQAISYLEAMAHSQDVVGDEVWALLLRGYASLGNSIRKLPEIEQRMNAYYRSIAKMKSPPDELKALAEELQTGGTARLFRPQGERVGQATIELETPKSEVLGETETPTAGQPVVAVVPGSVVVTSKDAEILAIAKQIGISAASTMKLKDTGIEPLQCIERTVSKLYFSGVLASKWVEVGHIRRNLKELLERLDSQGGDVRFLIINPKSDGFKRLSEMRQGQISVDCVPLLQDLNSAHASFHVRVFNSLPAFRVVIIDQDLVTFSPYLLAADDYVRGNRGWDAPHVVLDPFVPWALSEAFELMFLETWRDATPLEDI